MSHFETPEPISVVLELRAADVRVVAGDRADTIVEVRASDSSKRDDVTAAEQTRVEYADGTLLVKGPRRLREWSPFSDGGSIDVDIELPSGSDVSGHTAAGSFRCTGSLGRCELKSSAGEIRVDRAARVKLSTAGDITLEQVTGDAELTTATGDVRVGEIDGSAEVKNANGDTRIGEVGGDLRVKAANGDIDVDALARIGQRQDCQRPHPRRGHPPRLARRGDRKRAYRGRGRQWGCRLARPRHALRPCPQRPGRQRGSWFSRRAGRDTGEDGLRGHHDSPRGRSRRRVACGGERP